MDYDPLHLGFVRINQWLHAVELQASRILGPVLDPKLVGMTEYRHQWNQKMRDLDFLLIALNRFRLSVEAFNSDTGAERLVDALRCFKEVVPDIKDLRDIGEHFPDYDRGRGNLAKNFTETEQSYSWGLTDASIVYRGKRISLTKSLNASRNLHKVVMDFFKSQGVVINLDEWPLITYKI